MSYSSTPRVRKRTWLKGVEHEQEAGGSQVDRNHPQTLAKKPGVEAHLQSTLLDAKVSRESSEQW